MATKIYEDGVQVYGSNALGAKDIFKQRLEYQYQYPIEFKPETLKAGDLISQFDTPFELLSDIEGPEPINYWSANYQKYGKIDGDNNIIIPNIKNFKQIKTKNEAVFVLNFDSFLDIFLNLYFPKMMLELPLTKTGVLESRKISPNMSGLCVEISLDSHSNDYIKFNKYLNNVNYEFYTLAASKFGFLVDKNAPWRLVANLNSPKMQEYIQKHFFIIEKEGFTGVVLDHHHSYTIDESGEGITGPSKQTATQSTLSTVPKHYHIISNGKIVIKQGFGSNPLEPHIHGFGPAKKFVKGFTTSDIHKKFYMKTYTEDIEILRDTLVGFYNQFVDQYPFAETSQLCLPKNVGIGDYYGPNSARKTIIKSIQRPFLIEEDMILKYNDLFWFKTYLIIRIKEKTNGKGVADEKLNKVMSDINQLYYFVDKSSVMEYIQSYLRNYY